MRLLTRQMSRSRVRQSLLDSWLFALDTLNARDRTRLSSSCDWSSAEIVASQWPPSKYYMKSIILLDIGLHTLSLVAMVQYSYIRIKHCPLTDVFIQTL